MRLLLINVASLELTKQIRGIRPSLESAEEVIRPCAIRLKDGTFLPRAYCREHARYSDKGDWINPENVEEVLDSSCRLPLSLAKKLYAAGESGMGYIIYVLGFRDGRSLVCASAGLVDFPDLPDGYSYEEAVEVIPHEGRARSQSEGYRSDAQVVFLDYVPFDSPKLKQYSYSAGGWGKC